MVVVITQHRNICVFRRVNSLYLVQVTFRFFTLADTSHSQMNWRVLIRKLKSTHALVQNEG